MSIYKIISAFFLIAALSLTSLAAQTDGTGTDEDTGEPVVESKEPKTPRFELYGYLKLDASWDSDIVDAGNFARWVVSPAVVEPHDHFNMTARQTRLGLRIGGEVDGAMVVSGRVEIDFYGGGSENKNQPMLRHGYAEIEWPERGLDLKAGQTSDLISPLVPTTLNYPVAWWAGNIGYRRPQIRLTKTVKTGEHGSVAVAAALSRSIGDDFGQLEPGDSGADSGVPTVQLALSRRFLLAGQTAGVGISGHWGREELKEQRGEPVFEFDSWSVGLDFSLPMSRAFALRGELWTGQDLDDYLGGIGQGINRVTREAIEGRGGWLAMEGKPNSRGFLSVGASVDDPDDDDLLSGSRSRNGSVWVSYLHDVRSYLKVGVEISHWETEYLGGEGNSADRVQTALSYSF